MILIREYDTEDHPIIAEWWRAHGWEPVPECVLPALGVVAHNDDHDIAAAWLYMDNSVGVCWMEWFVGNPTARAGHIIKASSVIIDFLKQRAKEMGYGVMLTACRQPGLVKLYERNGFEVTDREVTHMIQPLIKV